MAANRQLKMELLKDQNHYTRNIGKILLELSKGDPGAFLLPVEKALASRALVKKLWDLLPGEQYCYTFNSVEEQTRDGGTLLPSLDLTQKVVLHLGWDVLGFSCSLEAAWQTWPNFSHLDTDTFNCCVYPEDLDWYVVRAGASLYPMIWVGDRYALKSC